MAEGPTRGATDDRMWSANLALAWLVRAGVALAPIIVAFGVTRAASAGFLRPPGWPGLALFIAEGAVVGAVAALLVGRVSRRVLPLAALLNMTLVFPDHAPSRFSVALRSGTMKQLSKSLVNGTVNWPRDHQQSAEMLVAMVGELGRHERLTRGHTERVRAYADLIGDELDISARDRELLHWGAMVHDIGKLTVPPEILNKQGGPTDTEWALLQQHPTAGGRMIEPLAGWLGEWRLAASQHHERWDGDGYPSGLAGTDISLAGRIVAVADAFDVITSPRSYKKAMSAEAARQEMVRCSGKQFDPDIVRALLNASLIKDRAALGFLGWFTELGGLSTIPRTVAQAAATTATAAAVVAGTVGVSMPNAQNPADQDNTATAPATAPAELAFLDLDRPRPTSEPAPTPQPTAVNSQQSIISNTDDATATADSPPTTDPTSTTSPTTLRSTTTAGQPTTPTTATTSVASTTKPPTTTSSSSTTTTITAITTTTVATMTTTPSAWDLGNPGTGNTTSQALLPLTGSIGSGSLPNYDTDRDSDPGLSISKGNGLSETDLTKMQRWSASAGDSLMKATATIDLWVATKDYDTGKTGRLAVGLYDCNTTATNCSLLASNTAQFNQATFGNDFGLVTVNLGAIDHTFATDRSLVLKVAATNSSDDDLWLAYGTTTYPTRLNT